MCGSSPRERQCLSSLTAQVRPTNMPTAKHFQCPFCAFNVTAMDEDEVIKHVAMHKQDHHPDANVNEADIRKMTKNIEVSRPGH